MFANSERFPFDIEVSDPDDPSIVSTQTVGKRQQSYGGYSYADLKLNKNWSTGFLFDYAPIIDSPGQRTLSYSPYVTWNLSEFNRLRLQYSYLNNNFRADKADKWQSSFSPMDDRYRRPYPRVSRPLELYRKEYVYEDEIVENEKLEIVFHIVGIRFGCKRA